MNEVEQDYCLLSAMETSTKVVISMFI